MFGSINLLKKAPAVPRFHAISRNLFELEKKPLFYPHFENSVRGSRPRTKTGGWNTVN